ncbi:biosynthetic arginine decarboxylase [Lyngbya confervoides]|uniref:Biosynthetic arginine decarboxylase n=1 Tax=Lyngbya confervoides BDU141951 TaxID=1574623 RepID=A0ABD4T1Z5_9CYAN|nr:biosynthetic arginine decarboxylase [Lyngbya confervoides]MCM1982674.1 biosynthetic arginine decarboxylase [Lyngbya confervoides BDU141951]
MTQPPVKILQQPPDHPSVTDCQNLKDSEDPTSTLAPSSEAGSHPGWSVEDSEKLYRIKGWGEPYFSVNEVGHVMVAPQGDRGGSLDLYDLVEALQERDIALPLLIRFSDILKDRIERLNASFAKAIARYNYAGTYRGVFPIKCNQQRHLVEDLVRFGAPYQFGLEAGSKPELLIAIATLEPKDSLLICNGYKDHAYIETAILAQRLGHNTIIVLEQVDEVDRVIEVSRRLGLEPRVGIRAKLNAKGIGRWGTSAGDRAKFGLTISEILEAVEKLTAAHLLESLKLLHFHIGSQISSISVIKDALREAGQIYVSLARLGAPMGYLDVGGGLGVDYDGSKSTFHASKNYNMQNYANDVVAAVKDACDEADIAVPTLVSESGRAIASHQSVLIFDILGSSDVTVAPPSPPSPDEPLVIRNLYETFQNIQANHLQEVYNDAIQFKDESLILFSFGKLSLTERAKAERLFWACCHKILTLLETEADIPDELAALEDHLASIYYANLSVFQSAPDTWAIKQLFPIMPIHRLQEQPKQKVTLADLTCDSDGKIDQFINAKNVKRVLELHQLQPNCPYYLGMFLNGAYQEIMGNLHNLFGDTNTVHIRLMPNGYQIEQVVRGDTMQEVLGYVQYDADDLLENLRRQSEQALRHQRITLEESKRLLKNYEQSLRSYTYLAP